MELSDEENVSATYTREQVLGIISRFQATTSDYLIQTYFEIMKIDSGPLHAKYQPRFNNIIFNNLKKITKKLASDVFIYKIPEIIGEDLETTTYVSCIYSFNLQRLPCPMFLQFFNPRRGIDHLLIRFTSDGHELGDILAQYGVLEKLVGYCGDFCYNDPGISACKSDHFSSLSLLTDRTIKYLPYSDGFIPRLFDILLDHLPENVSVSLIAVGETFLKMTPRSQFAKNLIKEYTAWLDNKKQPHILLSNYTKFITENFAMIKNYLEPFQCLPHSIESLLSDVSQRCLLIFMREIYMNVNEITLLDNHSAVIYYFQLVEIRDFFKMYEGGKRIPRNACICFNKELIQSNAFHPDNQAGGVIKLYKDILSVTCKSFTKALIYIASLLEQFPDFDNFSWVLLKNSSIDENQVHQTYHVIENATCAECPTLMEEVKQLNSIIARMPLLEMQDGVVAKWVAILEHCPTASLVTKLLEYLFSLPASVDLLRDYETDCDDSRIKTTVRFNMVGRSHEELVDHIEEFVGERMAHAGNIVKDCQIPVMID